MEMPVGSHGDKVIVGIEFDRSWQIADIDNCIGDTDVRTGVQSAQHSNAFLLEDSLGHTRHEAFEFVEVLRPEIQMRAKRNIASPIANLGSKLIACNARRNLSGHLLHY